MLIYTCYLILLLFSCHAAENQYGDIPNKKDNILEVTSFNNNFSTLNFLLIQSDEKSILEASGPLTLFAPTDEAFKEFTREEMTSLMSPENKGQLKRILLYHIVPQKLTPDELKKRKELKTIEGLILKVEEIKTSSPPEQASNGLIYPVDAVLIPKGSEPKGGAFSPYDAFKP